MAKPGRPRKPDVGKPSGAGRAGPDEAGIRDEELERRRRDLEATLAARRPEPEESGAAASSGATGYGQALKLSSEFIAGVAVGAGLEVAAGGEDGVHVAADVVGVPGEDRVGGFLVGQVRRGEFESGLAQLSAGCGD